jgi:hypothetical protein
MKKFYLGPKFGTLINRKWITNIWVVTGMNYSLLIIGDNKVDGDGGEVDGDGGDGDGD